MRKTALFLSLCLLLAGLAGCKDMTRDSFRVDTVVRIPLNPEESETEEITVPETAEASEIPEQTAEPETAAPTGSAKKSGSGKGGKSSSKSDKNDTETAPEPTEPVLTQPSETDPPKTEPLETEPPETEPPETEPPETDPPETEPPETQPPETEPAETSPTETQLPETEPPATKDPAADVYDISDYTPGSIAQGIADEINACRGQVGLDALSLDTRLSAIASVRAYEGTVSWSNTRPDERGGSSVMEDYGYSFGSTAEHLAYATGTPDAAALVAKWMSSKRHQQNILAGDFTTLGVGEYFANGMTYVAVIFVG